MNDERNERARRRLIESLRTSSPIAVTGAGVSVWAGYGTWPQVIDHLAAAVRGRLPDIDTARMIHDNPNPLNCAKRLGAYLGPDFGDFIRAEFGPNGTNPDDVVYRLCGLPFSHFLTFNFDRSLEQVHASLNQQYRSVSSSNPRDLTAFMRSHAIDGIPRQVLHLHGSYADPPELIALTDDGYPNFGSQHWRALLLDECSAIN